MRIRAVCGTAILLSGCATGQMPYSGVVLDQSFTISGESTACTGRYVRGEEETEVTAPIACQDGRTGTIAIRTNSDGHPLVGTASLADGSTTHVVFQPLLGDRHARARATDLRETSREFVAAQQRTPSQRATYSRASAFRTYYRGPRGGCYYINSNGNKTYVDRSLCR